MLKVYTSLLTPVLLLLSALVTQVNAMTLTWNPNPERDIGGYKLHHGTASRNYTTVLDVGNITSCSLTNLFLYENTPYFVALTAYDRAGNESSFSHELPLLLDDLIDDVDNCPDVYNPDQSDSYPPPGNAIGDACECEGDFACDGDVDGWDAALFKADANRNRYNQPCTAFDSCNGDFDCDGDVDGWDAMLFKEDSGRNAYNKPCPSCAAGDWCMYQ